MLFGRVGIAFGPQHPQGLDDLRTGVGRIDDLVDVPQFCSLVRVGKFLAVFRDQPLAFLTGV
jgi:hypothetical protein